MGGRLLAGRVQSASAQPAVSRTGRTRARVFKEKRRGRGIVFKFRMKTQSGRSCTSERARQVLVPGGATQQHQSVGAQRPAADSPEAASSPRVRAFLGKADGGRRGNQRRGLALACQRQETWPAERVPEKWLLRVGGQGCWALPHRRKGRTRPLGSEAGAAAPAPPGLGSAAVTPPADRSQLRWASPLHCPLTPHLPSRPGGHQAGPGVKRTR